MGDPPNDSGLPQLVRGQKFPVSCRNPIAQGLQSIRLFEIVYVDLEEMDELDQRMSKSFV